MSDRINSNVRFFIADDHSLVRDLLRNLISKNDTYTIVGESGDGREACILIETIKPDVVLLDISMPSMSGVDVARKLKKFYPEMKIIIVTHYDYDEYVEELLSIGVEGYVLKHNSSEELLVAISEVLKGNNYLSPQVTKKVMTTYKKRTEPVETSIFSILSPRETEIMKMIAEGKTNKDIASLLFISTETVKTHRSNMMKKLNFTSVTDIVRFAVKAGIIDG